MNRKLNLLEILVRKFKRYHAANELLFQNLTSAGLALAIHLVLPVSILIYLAL